MKSTIMTILSFSLILSACTAKPPTKHRFEQAIKDMIKLTLNKAERQADLHTFITLDAKAKPSLVTGGKLSGMVLVVKDNIHVEGLPNTAGTPALSGFIPTKDAPVIARLKAEGAVIIGKANMHELAFGITSHNAVFGAVENPYDHTRFPGGSSGGSAVAVAARIVPAAIGTDTGGSLRIPAALTGIIGFRPSLGRYPASGITPISHTRDVPGPMALDMDTITLLDSVMADRPQVTRQADLKTIRLGVARTPFYQNLDPETKKVMDTALEKLQMAGVTLVEMDMPELAALNEKTSFPIALYEGTYDLEKYLESNHTGVTFFELARRIKSPDVKALFDGLAADKNKDGHPDGVIPKVVYEEAIKEGRPAMVELYKHAFKTHKIDALVFPTTILPAGPIEGTEETISHNGKAVPTFATYIQNTDPGSNAGMPGISLPIGLTKDGLPVGLELDALPGDDKNLLAIARAVVSLFGQLPPPPL